MQRTLRDDTIDSVVQFWRRHGYYDLSYDRLWFIIARHLELGTLLIERNRNKEIVGICRFNINGTTCHCLDVVIRPDYRNKHILKLMIIRGLRKFPMTTTLVYERGLRGNKRRSYNIMKFLRLEK